MKNPKLTQSLRFDLIFDLSLLTLCALILSVGLLILVLRYKVPRDMTDLAQSYLTTLHEGFTKSDEFHKLGGDYSNSESLRGILKNYLQARHMGERWSSVDVEPVRALDSADH